MDNKNRVIGAKASSTGDKVLHLIKGPRIGIADLAGISGIYGGARDNGFYE